MRLNCYNSDPLYVSIIDFGELLLQIKLNELMRPSNANLLSQVLVQVCDKVLHRRKSLSPSPDNAINLIITHLHKSNSIVTVMQYAMLAF
mmetsp:Transcript_27284/g.41503  ORF Transcript_27284/g.41503 Transcript_27284/m.41503 type:complete len:90 (-) Transcript_27284:49-318(-)